MSNLKYISFYAFVFSVCLRNLPGNCKTLSHLLVWLINQCGSPATECRHQCMALVFNLSSVLPGEAVIKCPPTALSVSKIFVELSCDISHEEALHNWSLQKTLTLLRFLYSLERYEILLENIF